MRIAVLHNAVPDNAPAEDQDTLVQARAVAHALESRGHEPAVLPLDNGLEAVAAMLGEMRPDAVFNLVERLDGTDAKAHLAAAMLEDLGLPCTGSGSRALRDSVDKLSAKRILLRAGLPTPEWFAPPDLEDRPREARGDFILKSATEHASFGMDESALFWSWSAEDMAEALEERAGRHGGEWFAERFVHGREFNVSLLDTGTGPRVLPVAEILFQNFGSKPGIVDWEAKWREDSHAYNHTPRRFDFPQADASLLEELASLAKACGRAFDLAGHARVDFRVNETGRPFIIDVNANPCLSPDAGFAAALARAGLDYALTLESLVLSAFSRPKTRGRRAA